MQFRTYSRLTAFMALCAINAVIIWPHTSKPITASSQEENVSSNAEQNLEIERLTKEKNERRETAESWDKWNIRATFFAGLAATCLVITAIGVSRSNGNLAKVSDELDAAKNAQTAHSLGELQIELADAKLEMAKQQTRAANAEKALLELQERLKDRHLPPDKRKELVALLQAGPKARIMVACIGGHPEPCAFAAEIVDALKEGGWMVTAFNQGVAVIGNAPPGLMIRVPGEERVYHANALQKALDQVGLKTQREFIPATPDAIVQLMVGAKP